MTSTSRILAGVGVGLALVLAGCGEHDSSTAATARAADGPADELPDGRIALGAFTPRQRSTFVSSAPGAGSMLLDDNG